MATRRDYSPETDAAIFALRAANWTTAAIARALGRTPISLEHHLARLKKKGVDHPFRQRPARRLEIPETNAPDGETWTDVPARGLSISSANRVKSLRSGYLISQFNRDTGEPAVNFEAGGQRGTITLRRLRLEAGGEPEPSPKRFRPHEDEKIRKAASINELKLALPHRTDSSLRNRARLLGVRLRSVPREILTPPAVRATRWVAQISYEEICAAAPARLLPDVRDDLIQAVTLLYGEGYTGALADAFEYAKRDRRRQWNDFAMTSIDTPLGSDDGPRLMDLFDSERLHF